MCWANAFPLNAPPPLQLRAVKNLWIMYENAQGIQEVNSG